MISDEWSTLDEWSAHNAAPRFILHELSTDQIVLDSSTSVQDISNQVALDSSPLSNNSYLTPREQCSSASNADRCLTDRHNINSHKTLTKASESPLRELTSPKQGIVVSPDAQAWVDGFFDVLPQKKPNEMSWEDSCAVTNFKELQKITDTLKINTFNCFHKEKDSSPGDVSGDETESKNLTNQIPPTVESRSSQNLTWPKPDSTAPQPCSMNNSISYPTTQKADGKSNCPSELCAVSPRAIIFSDGDLQLLSCLSKSGSAESLITREECPSAQPPRGGDGSDVLLPKHPPMLQLEQDETALIGDSIGNGELGKQALDTSVTTTTDANVSERIATRKSSTSSCSSTLSVFHIQVEGSEHPEKPRQRASVSPEMLEDPDKKTVFIIPAKGKRTPVSWFADTNINDVREAILCACDAIMDGGFTLREVKICSVADYLVHIDHTDDLVEWVGDSASSSTTPQELDSMIIDGTPTQIQKLRVYEFEEFDRLRHGVTYLLEAGVKRSDLAKVTGDKFRRLKIQIDPMLHVEISGALKKMRSGTNLLKHTKKGFPHLRQFQLCSDNKRLIWYSTSKLKTASTVYLANVTEIKLGQTTQVFKKYPLAMLAHLSFSLIYTSCGGAPRTLDLTCKDEPEFDIWLIGLKALVHAACNRRISKHQLLSHSQRYQKAVRAEDMSLKFTEFTQSTGVSNINLTSCIELPAHSRDELKRKLVALQERITNLQCKIQNSVPPITPVTNGLPNTEDKAQLSDSIAAFQPALLEPECIDDAAMEKARMFGLISTVIELLKEADSQLTGKDTDVTALKSVNQLLWKTEVDVENAEDMYQRITGDMTTPQFVKTIAEINHQMAEEFQRLGHQIAQTVAAFFVPSETSAPNGRSNEAES